MQSFHGIGHGVQMEPSINKCLALYFTIGYAILDYKILREILELLSIEL